MSIFKKINTVRSSVKVAKKDKSGYGYKYVSEEAILSMITGKMQELGLLLVPKIPAEATVITPVSFTRTKVSKAGQPLNEQVNETLIYGDMVWEWVDTESGEMYDVPWIFVSQQGDASQAFGSALTYASRYFLLKFFNVATIEDDPDAWRAKTRQAESKEQIDAVLNDVRVAIETVLMAEPSRKPEIEKIALKHIKVGGKASANYVKADSPIMLAAFLAELTAMTKKGE